MLNDLFSHSSSLPLMIAKVVLLLMILATILTGLIVSLQWLQNLIINKRQKFSKLAVRDRLFIDKTRKIIVISWEDKEYLLFIGNRNEFLIDHNPPQEPAKPQE